MGKINQHWVSQGAAFGDYDIPQPAIRNPQSGYALVSLLVFMSLLALFALTAPRKEFGALANLIPRVTDVLDTKSSGPAPGGEDNSENSSGPFLGVSSRSRRNSVITFYGIDRHDEWIFTPLFR